MVDRSRVRAEGSSGLGLAIVHWIVEAHGGNIEVDSTVGRGTTFTVKIPLHNFETPGFHLSRPCFPVQLPLRSPCRASS